MPLYRITAHAYVLFCSSKEKFKHTPLVAFSPLFGQFMPLNLKSYLAYVSLNCPNKQAPIEMHM